MKSLRKLAPFLRPFLWILVISGLLAIPLAALRTSPVPLVNYLVDDLLVKKNAKHLYLFPAAIIAIYLLNFVVRFFHYYLLRVVIVRVNQRIKNQLYRHLLGLSADRFTQQSTGTLISRIGTDPQHLDGGISCINVLIREPLTFLILFGYAFYLNWKLTLITLIIFPALYWVFAATGRNLKNYITKMQEENASLFSTLQETFTGIRLIKAFRLEKWIRKRFRTKIERYARVGLKAAALEEAAHPMVELITAFAIAAVIYYGGLQVLTAEMTSGGLLAFFTAFALMMDPIRKLNDVNIKLNTAASSADRIFAVLGWQTRLHEPKNPIPIAAFNDKISFQNVQFAYPDTPERQVLKGISFDIPKGCSIAIVGESGAGKSSLVNLLPRVFDVTAGKIAVDGHDIKELAFDDLRNLIAVVSQDVFLFNDTIGENIRCGRLDARAEEIEEAARQAFAYEFIQDLPEGFNSIIGDRGQKLSGGERQRISIARAFLREAPILILDEATSSLDTASEKMVQKALETLMKNRTVLIIAHRLSTVRDADQIIVLKEGRIVETGRHQDLISRNGEYARFQKLSHSAH